MHELLKELDEGRNSPVTVWEDNQGVASWRNSWITRAMYVAVGFNFLKDLVQSGTLCVNYCSTDEMLAYIFTKPFLHLKFEKHRAGLAIKSVRQRKPDLGNLVASIKGAC